MKQRVKIDSAILSFFVILSGFLYQFPNLYSSSIFFDNIMDFFGFLFLLKGTFLRMVARAHKKNRSGQGEKLVTSGIYTVVRNPMYLGSFLIGLGYVLLVWPWWASLIFGVLFYLRFQRQIIIEEKHLSKVFGREYEEYCKKVPRILPTWKIVKEFKMNRVINLKEAFETKEKFGLVWWPVLGLLLETLQEKIIFGFFDFKTTVTIAVIAYVFFYVDYYVKSKIFR